jgi:type IV pilus assembly protein PilE
MLFGSNKIMSNQRGFTLIELLIAVAIIGILGAVAYPSYMNSVTKTRREEGKRTLVEAAQQLENYYAMNLSYTGAITGTSLTIYTTNDDFNDYYTLTASAPTTSTFTLTATPTGSQSSDSCGTLTINSTGTTTPSTSGCW